MFLDKKNLLKLFFAALTLTLFAPVVVPGYPIYFLAPVIVVALYQKSLLHVCWIAMGCGVILDLLYAQDRFGPYTISFVTAAVIVYAQKRHFFADSLTTLPIMTFLFSFSVGLLQFAYVKIFERSVSITFGWGLTDLLILPMLDCVAALVLFILPSLVLGNKPRRGEEYFAG